MDNVLLDSLNRPLKDLRISLIDRCNFRCTYCMPEDQFEHYKFLDKKEWLTFDEIERLVRIFAGLGVTKVRLTGGEPLLRPGLDELIGRLAGVPGIRDLALTTNGALLYQYAALLRQKGLQRVTVSVDSLDPQVNRVMSGGRADINEILEGIDEAKRAGFESIKINVVVQRGVNDGSVVDLVRYFKARGHSVRFIEYMDVGTQKEWDYRYVVPSKEILAMIGQEFPLEPAKNAGGGEVAARYTFKDGKGEVGVIPSVTAPFCSTCTRLRLSADGKLFTCLFASEGTDLRALIRDHVADDGIRAVIREVWAKRQDRYSELRAALHKEGKIPPKVEMFAIGG